MVSKKKQKKAPEKTTQLEDIYLNDLQVEIKQEEELIIEDADHVQWRFIGMDDDDDATDEVVDGKWEQSPNTSAYAINQYQNTSFDEVIEISDEENYNYEAGAISGGDNSEILITNEPLQDSIIEILRKHKTSTSEDTSNETESASPTNDLTDSSKANSVGVNEIKYSGDCVQKISDCELKTTTPLPFNDDKLVGNVDCFNVGTFIEWMTRKLIKMCCYICGVEFHRNVYTWLSHMKHNHPNILREISTKCKPLSESVVVCKVCKMQVTPKINHIFHYMTRHMKPKPQIFSCSFCDYKNFSVATLQRHQLENHPTVIGKRENCPKCDESFKDSTALDYHFMSVHIREFNGKYIYKCHLCDGAQFESSKNKLFAHLIDKHKLANWKILNYRKNGTFLSCTKCHKIFIKSNVQNLLGHYLTHEEKSFWSCKYCKSTNRFKDWPMPHLCRAMRTYIEVKKKAANGNIIDKINVQQRTQCQGKEERPVSWDEFEAYIEHICPFCNKGFLKFEEWRCHVREAHYIHTLHGLNMTVLHQENEKLLCLECDAHVPKSALELHKHRFQHLPFEPYKCRHCAKCLATYNKAVNHVQNNCQDGGHQLCGGQTTDDQTANDRNDSVTPSQETASEGVIIMCPFCNNKRFSDFTQLSKHFANVHDNFDKYFTKPSKDRSRACKICVTDMKGDKLSKLIAHFLQHLNERPFKCQKCSRSYPVYGIALKHVRSYHSTNTNAEHCFRSIKEEPECHIPTVPKREPETECHLAVTTIPVLNSVVTPTSNCMPAPTPNCSSSPILLTPPPSQTTEISIPVKEDNSNETINVADFKGHIFKMYEQYIRFACPECNQPFRTFIKWETHINSEHSFYKGNDLRCIVAKGKGRVKCLDCHAHLPVSASKQQNHKLIHMPFRPFICTFCLNHFTTIASLYKHFRNCHFLRGKFQCDICLKRLPTDFQRWQHVNQDHPREKWPINMCTTCLKIVEDMEAHLNSSHLAHSRKYRCDTCGVYFEFPKELEVHMERIHLTAKAANEISLHVASTINRSGGKRKLRSLSSDDNAKKFRPSVSHSKSERFD